MKYQRDLLPPGFEGLLARRSVRSFSSRTVDDPVRQAVLQAGAQAPSAHGSHPVRYWVLEDPEIRRRLVKAFPWFRPLLEAGLAVFVLGLPGVCVQPEYWTVDAAASTQNLITAGQLFGLGSVWLGIAPVEDNLRKVRDLLAFPDGVEPFAIVALGYPSPEAKTEPRALRDLETLLVEGSLRGR